MKIIDNYLSDNLFNDVYDYIHNTNIFWLLGKKANDNSTNEHHFHLFHNFIYDSKPVYKNSNKLPVEIMSVYAKQVKQNFEIGRARANLFIKTSNIQQHMGFHKDAKSDEDYTLLLYLEDSNGYTNFKDGYKVESKKNRAVIFSTALYHETVTQTNTLYRSNININFKDIK